MPETPRSSEAANPPTSPLKADRSGLTALLLPIKDLRNAKQRLAGVLTAQERSELAHAMLADTARAIESARRADKVFIVSSSEPAFQIAAEHRWEIIREEMQVSESASVDFASRVCAERGITRLLRLPLDIPLVQSQDIDEILATEVPSPGVLLVPSRDGTGTNAILRTPPTLFPSHFGPDSLSKHRQEAAVAGARVIIRQNDRVAMDVDDASDLRALLQSDLSHTTTGAWLEKSGVALRFRPLGRAAQPP